MDIGRVKAIASDPKRTRKELEQMRQNAIARGNVEAQCYIETILRERFPGAAIALDREDPQVAKTVLESMFPRKTERLAILSRLVHSIDVANAVAPNAWAVTLFPDAFRLNVGQVEVFVAYPAGFFLNCAASAEAEPFRSLGCEESTYAAVPQPQCRYSATAQDLRRLPPDVDAAHRRFIDLAARAPSGKPRAGTSFSSSHSKGFVTYARKSVDEARRSR